MSDLGWQYAQIFIYSSLAFGLAGLGCWYGLKRLGPEGD
ncbi:hypothetical protein [Rhizobium phage RHph_X2_25]|nr:hypothetical protein [Rhizobium phage RHph_X2_25]